VSSLVLLPKNLMRISDDPYKFLQEKKIYSHHNPNPKNIAKNVSIGVAQKRTIFLLTFCRVSCNCTTF
jgi:hypothetical protein